MGREAYFLCSFHLYRCQLPDNTGNDFIYNDTFNMDKDEYDEEIGAFDEDGNRLFRKNTESNGRFHSDWCSMMYPRLKLAQGLLRDDGVIFISIDDNEVENLKKLGNEIFGADNFVASIIWERVFAPKNDSKYLSESHDYILMYCKNKELFKIGMLERTEEANNRYKNYDNDERGVWISDNLTAKRVTAKDIYPIITPGGREVYPTHGSSWRVSKEKFLELLKDNRIWFGEDGNNVPRLKRFLNEVQDGMVCTTIWFYREVGHNQEGRQELKKIFDGKGYFDGPKPKKLLNKILKIANTSDDDIILDFFSGSATTAHAVMQLNAEDGGNRKHIMIQLQEKCKEDTEAFKAGYKNICEIGKERIRRAGKKIAEEIEEKNKQLELGTEPTKIPDIGFRVLKIDSTNMKDVYYSAEEITQQSLTEFESNIKEDRTDIDLLYGVMLDWGLPLSLSHKTEKIDGVAVHIVDENSLIACFETNINEDIIRQIAKKQALRVVFRDSSFANSPDKLNVEQIFKTLSPTTKVMVI